jgi:hypothetical protein
MVDYHTRKKYHQRQKVREGDIAQRAILQNINYGSANVIKGFFHEV